jgi:thiol-disulfide isomerase/thioredoxin
VKNAEGKFSKKIERISIGGDGEPPAFAAMIVARGYLPEMTPKVYLGKPYEPFVIKLKKGSPIAGVVKDAAGKLVQGAQAVFVRPQDVTYVEGLTVNDDFTLAPRLRVKTDAKGAFELPATADAGRVLVLDKAGYAIRPSGDFVEKAGVEVKLTPWARVEGDLIVDDQPVNGRPIQLRAAIEKAQYPKGPNDIYFDMRTATRPDGKFSFDRVPSHAPLTLSRDTENGPSGNTPIEAKAGQTVTVHLGDKRQAAAGKMDIGAVVADAAKLITTADRQVRVRAFRIDPAPAAPAGWQDRAAWDAAVEALKKSEPSVDAPISALAANAAATTTDGSVRFDDLLPGHYVRYANIHAPMEANMCGWGRVLANARVEFDVPPPSADQKPLDLPALPLVAQSYPKVGDAAPPIGGKTMSAGKPFALEKLRGKVVLIDFWASWCAPCMAAMPEMKKLHERFGRDGRVVFVGGNFDFDAKAAQGALDELKLPWEQVALGTLLFENPVCRAYGVAAIPSTWIISPDGKVLAKDLRRSEEIAAALDKALSAK